MRPRGAVLASARKAVLICCSCCCVARAHLLPSPGWALESLLGPNPNRPAQVLAAGSTETAGGGVPPLRTLCDASTTGCLLAA